MTAKGGCVSGIEEGGSEVDAGITRYAKEAKSGNPQRIGTGSESCPMADFSVESSGSRTRTLAIINNEFLVVLSASVTTSSSAQFLLVRFSCLSKQILRPVQMHVCRPVCKAA
jgi:hypothetical protein